MRVVWSPTAARQIARVFEYLAQFNPQAAADVSAALIAAGESLQHFPHRGRLVPNTKMRDLIASYRYIIRYRVHRDHVLILRVRHMSRRPTNP